MRAWTAVSAIFVTLTPLLSGADKLTEQDRIELMRGLLAEYATVKQLLPRAKKALPFESTGSFDKKVWEAASREYGPAGRVGDLVHITKVFIESDKLVLQINGGFNGGRKWYEGAQIGGGIGGGGSMTPLGKGDSNAPGGTTIEILFHKPLEPMKAAEGKKMLSLGRPNHKSREVKDGIELEDWVFGQPPGRITFVTFNGSKVIKVKEEYAGLGTEVADPKAPR